jgi:hypothetical protein
VRTPLARPEQASEATVARRLLVSRHDSAYRLLPQPGGFEAWLRAPNLRLEVLLARVASDAVDVPAGGYVDRQLSLSYSDECNQLAVRELRPRLVALDRDALDRGICKRTSGTQTGRSPPSSLRPAGGCEARGPLEGQTRSTIAERTASPLGASSPLVLSPTPAGTRTYRPRSSSSRTAVPIRCRPGATSATALASSALFRSLTSVVLPSVVLSSSLSHPARRSARTAASTATATGTGRAYSVSGGPAGMN